MRWVEPNDRPHGVPPGRCWLRTPSSVATRRARATRTRRTVATSFDESRVSTIGADMQHYLEWKDTAPVPLSEVARELGVGAPANLSSQQKLIAPSSR